MEPKFGSRSVSASRISRAGWLRGRRGGTPGNSIHAGCLLQRDIEIAGDDQHDRRCSHQDIGSYLDNPLDHKRIMLELPSKMGECGQAKPDPHLGDTVVKSVVWFLAAPSAECKTSEANCQSGNRSRLRNCLSGHLRLTAASRCLQVEGRSRI